MPILEDVTQAVGNTPLVRINRIIDAPEGTTVAAKLEFYNPASSVKDRIGVAIIDAAEASGELKPGGTIVEATSGNTGIALAMVGAARGYKVVLAMPETMSKERRALLRAYGAELVLTPGRGHEGRRRQGRGDRRRARGRGPRPPVRQRGQPGGPPQHHRRGDLARHRRQGRHRRRRHRHGRHDHRRRPGPQGAQARTSRSSPSSPRSPRSSTAARPARTRSRASARTSSPRSSTPSVYDEVIDINADTAVEWARKAATEEGLLVGISSGAALAAANQVATRPENAGKTIVVIIPSFGERYLSTVLFEGLVD